MADRWEDDAVRRILQSGKEESDRRAARGLPLDGDFEPHSRADEIEYQRRSSSSSSGGGGSLIGPIIVAVGGVIFYILKFGLWLAWEIVRAIASIIFSSRR